MELDWLEDFLALVDAAHFSRAAEKRNISQPAFSRRIKMLETWIGAPLFNRATHRIELTAAGEQWKPTAEDVFAPRPPRPGAGPRGGGRLQLNA